MYLVQYTKTAHVKVPESCWIDGSRHRKLSRAAAAAERVRIDTGQNGTWANNVRVVDLETGETVDLVALADAQERLRFR